MRGDSIVCSSSHFGGGRFPDESVTFPDVHGRHDLCLLQAPQREAHELGELHEGPVRAAAPGEATELGQPS